jgi:hypothetical protein
MSLLSNNDQHLLKMIENNQKRYVYNTHMFVLLFDYDDGVRKTAG